MAKLSNKQAKAIIAKVASPAFKAQMAPQLAAMKPMKVVTTPIPKIGRASSGMSANQARGATQSSYGRGKR